MTNNRIAVGSVVEGISGAGYVRTDADGLVLDPGDSPSIGTADITAGAITTPKLADDAVTTAKITNLAVTDAKISSLAFSKLTSLPTTLAGYGIAASQAATGAWTLAGSLALSAGSGGTTVFTTAITGESASRFILKANGSMYLTNGTATDSVRERKSGGGFYEYRTTAADNPGTGNIIEYLGNGGSGLKFAITEDGKTYLTATGSTSAQHYLTNGAVEGSIYASSSIGGFIVGSITNYPLYFLQNGAIVATFYGSSFTNNKGYTQSGSDSNSFSGVTTFSAKTNAAASTTAGASLNIPSGTAPTSPVDGDLWFDGTNLKLRVSGATYTITKS